MIKPIDYQPPLPTDHLILNEHPKSDAVSVDVLFIGAGPAGLAGAIELAKLVKAESEQSSPLSPIQIAVLEKANALGEHCLSGAIVNPTPLRELFPDLAISDLPFYGQVNEEHVYFLTKRRHLPIPTPPPMRNKGNYFASICELVRWMGAKAEEYGVSILPGFPVQSLLTEGGRVIGARTVARGLTREGTPGPNYTPPTDISAKVTVLCEGTRGALTQAYFHRNKISAPNPPIFSLGVKELWETKKVPKGVIHTLGWPLPRDVFGGTFLYPMGENLVSLGLVASLDYRRTSFDLHDLLQTLKQHPLFQAYLVGGNRLEWGAKTIPEGGFYSIPEKLHGDGLLIAGDAAGLVNVAALKGIHYAMQSGILAARTLFHALKMGDTSAQALQAYDKAINNSFIMDDLYEYRNLRLAFKDGLFRGGLKAAMITLTHSRIANKRIDIPADADALFKSEAPDLDPNIDKEQKIQQSKVDSVYLSGNTTRDDIPQHLIVGKEIPTEVARLYQHMCPAGVYELRGEKLVINAPNCIDCKATDVLGPRWMPREGGSGPRYRKM